jgi:hypothetical protein
MWLPEDTEAALEWQRWQRQLCSGCGQPTDETMDADGPGYDAVALRCRACETRDRSAEQWRSQGGSTEGLFFSIETHHHDHGR